MKTSEARPQNSPARIYEFADFRLDTLKRLLQRRDGTVVPLASKAYDTLVFLVQHSDTVLDKERLMEAVWPDSIVEENNLTQSISVLRRVFGEKRGSHRFIVTVPGRGYRFVAEVKTCENRADPQRAAEAPTTDQTPGRIEPLSIVLPPRACPRYLGALIVAFLLLGLAAFFFIRSRAYREVDSPKRIASPAISIPEKSIAVLPLENLSDDKENTFFADGLHEDILTSVAKISALKVISRTSVMAFQKPGGLNLREIARALGVANVLEGSVQREGNRVLVNVQLIDARNDQHLWAERYDRTVADSMGLQGELATQIAAALKATLAPEEKARLDVEPTANSEAYMLYLTALGKEATDQIAAEQLYVRATAIDPKFALAYARASLLNSRIASYDQDRAGKAKARAQAEEALRLSPTLGEAHMALGVCLYWGEKKYDAALKEFDIATAASPNNAEIYTYIGGIYRRQGRWREAVAIFERALSLDPRNARIAFRSAFNHLYVRDWPAAAADYKRASEIAPGDLDSRVGLAYLEVVQNNNPAAGRNILQTIPPAIDPNDELISARWDLAMMERNYASAEKILADYRGEKLARGPKTFYQGRIALACGDIESAQRFFAAVTPSFEESLRDDPADSNHHAELGLLYAYMHRKEDAIRESRRAVELEPESQNAFHGATWAGNLALVYALVGEQDQAITLIERLLSTPGPVQVLDQPQNITLAELRLRWEWDSLRSNPRFQKILAAPEPKTDLTTRTQVMPAATPIFVTSAR